SLHLTEVSMKRIYFGLFAVVLAGMILACGCTSQTAGPSSPAGTASPATPSATVPVKETSLDALPGMALKLSDFPKGYVMVYEGEAMPPDESTLLSDPDYLGGYTVTASNESSELSSGELVDQLILVYRKPVTRENLETVFLQSYPELANWSLSPIDDPGIGDAGIAYQFMYPNASLNGFVIAFGKGDIFEIFVTMAGDDSANYSLLEDLAKKAVSKIG
ncbi:MAG: hypothetical protein LUQ01_00690, partial [Methanolinea sp.]|nr:hypothetical protein [Methanolinea sp.]